MSTRKRIVFVDDEVHVASYLTHEAGSPAIAEDVPEILDQAFLEAIGALPRLLSWRESARAGVAEATAS